SVRASAARCAPVQIEEPTSGRADDGVRRRHEEEDAPAEGAACGRHQRASDPALIFHIRSPGVHCTLDATAILRKGRTGRESLPSNAVEAARWSSRRPDRAARLRARTAGILAEVRPRGAGARVPKGCSEGGPK